MFMNEFRISLKRCSTLILCLKELVIESELAPSTETLNVMTPPDTVSPSLNSVPYQLVK